ncbi:MAG: hypothetical protein ACXV8O_14620 [Methylobacter sp.]
MSENKAKRFSTLGTVELDEDTGITRELSTTCFYFSTNAALCHPAATGVFCTGTS